MPNRAERRAQAKAGRRGVPSQYDQTRGRGRSGMIDEYQLQQKSQRLQDGTDGTEWKPSGGTIADTETLLTTNPNYTNPKMFKAPHSLRQWFRVGSWTLIAIAIIAFFVVMWLPSHPMWLDHHRFRGVHCGCAEPVLYGWRFQAQSESGPERHGRLIFCPVNPA